MGRVYLITGGVRSGKSTCAVERAMKYEDRAYIATAVVEDDEMRERVRKHQAEREGKFTTYETNDDLPRLIHESRHQVILLDCVSNLVSSLMRVIPDYEMASISERECVEKDILAYIDEIAQAAIASASDVIFVTNELGQGMAPLYALGRQFRDTVGRANQILACAADEVYLMICGLPVTLKGDRPD
ncbi:MAG: bifunctional adenosylcobinamide kinase/adenosylcobinamide-phosphate guanylyltransferase [Christensenellales bacterium]|jgi:adenosylcobinamide kinase/adenosylcobinamide-phosphate guanylyltransferase